MRTATGFASIPETAIERCGELSPAAFYLFCYYCARRNKVTGGWRVRDKDAAARIGMSRNRLCEARNELRAKGWIACEGGNFIRPLMGFNPVESSTDAVEFPTASVEDSTLSVGGSTGRIYKERARGFTDPTTSPNTDTPPPLAAAPRPAPARPHVGGVRVSGTAYSLQQRWEYAQAHAQSISQPTQWVWSKRACAGEFDEAIRDWYGTGKPFEGRRADAQSRDTSACPDCHGKGHYFADPKNPNTLRRCKHPQSVEPPAGEPLATATDARAETEAPSTGASPVAAPDEA
jgi:hypothetical protein